MEGYVPYQLALISSRLSRALETAYKSTHELSRTEWRALALVAETSECASAKLVERSGMDAVAVHRAVKHLESLGYISRQSVAHDRRVKSLRITPEGWRVYQTIVPSALALEQRVLQSLSADEAKFFKSALNKLMSETLSLAAD